MPEQPRIVLVGPPGAGKSTVGAALADRLDTRLHDTDAAIEQAQGRSISDIFVQDGEAAFRALERAEVLRALREAGTVLALGGGAVLDPAVQDALQGHWVVFLDVSIADAAGRVGFDASRPLLVVNPRASWLRLMAVRRPVYEAVSTVVVDTAGRTPAEVTDEVLTRLGEVPGAVSRVQIVSVGGQDGYAVHVGSDALAGLGPHLRPGRRVLVVHQPGHPGAVTDVVGLARAAETRVWAVQVPDAEAAKEVAVLADLWGRLGRAGFTRDDLIVGVGGGAVTDLAGFVAATWLRGVDLVQVPTTLLGVVDAAVGGKTGINTAEGKNLVGAFHAPLAVLCDPGWLTTLPRADYVSGLAEVLKCGLIADPEILRLVQDDPEGAVSPASEVAPELIARAVQVKADVVTADLRESLLREVLNYGHTFAHAVEQVQGYTWRHGDAVAVGLVYAAEVGVRAGVTPEGVLASTREVLGAVGLPTTYPGDESAWEGLRAAMARDKKARGSTVRFVVLEDLAHPVRLDGPAEHVLRAAYDAVRA